MPGLRFGIESVTEKRSEFQSRGAEDEATNQRAKQGGPGGPGLALVCSRVAPRCCRWPVGLPVHKAEGGRQQQAGAAGAQGTLGLLRFSLGASTSEPEITAYSLYWPRTCRVCVCVCLILTRGYFLQ